MGCYLHQRIAFRRASRDLLAGINGVGIEPLQGLGRVQRLRAVREDSGSGHLIVGDAAGAAAGAAGAAAGAVVGAGEAAAGAVVNSANWLTNGIVDSAIALLEACCRRSDVAGVVRLRQPV